MKTPLKEAIFLSLLFRLFFLFSLMSYVSLYQLLVYSCRTDEIPSRPKMIPPVCLFRKPGYLLKIRIAAFPFTVPINPDNAVEFALDGTVLGRQGCLSKT